MRQTGALRSGGLSELVSSVGGDDTLSGAYCVKTGTEFDAGSGCTATCDPKTSPCP